jgi:hypothetical protein
MEIYESEDAAKELKAQKGKRWVKCDHNKF